jgi:hypothetical protein
MTQLAAVAGINSLNEDLTEFNILKITESFVHEVFNNMIINDIALLKLEKQIQFTDNIRAVCLPREPNFVQEAFTAGWLLYLFF